MSQDLLKLAGGVALGLTPLLYLPLRSAAQPEFVYVGHYDAAGAFHPLDLTQAGNLLWYLSGGPFGERVFGYSGAELVTESIRFLHRLWGAFLGVGLPLGAWGLWNLRKQRSLALGLLLTALPHAIFFIGYHTPDKETMFLPVYLIWAVFLGVGLSHLRDIWPAPAARLAPLLLPLGLLLINLPYLDVSQVPNPHQIAVTRLQSADPNAIYLARWDEAAAMTYLQLTSDLRPDVTIINTFLSTPQVEQALVQNAQRTQRPVYITDPDSILARQYHLISVEHGFQLQ